MSAVEMEGALDRYRTIRAEIQVLFRTLAEAPERYGELRDRLDALDLDRLNAATCLGEIVGSAGANDPQAATTDGPTTPQGSSHEVTGPKDPDEASAEPTPPEGAEDPGVEVRAEEPVGALASADRAPASAEQVAAFRACYEETRGSSSKFTTCGPRVSRSAPPGDPHPPQQFALSLGIPPDLRGDADAIAEIERLELATRRGTLASLRPLDHKDRHAVFEYVIARVRAAQIAVGGSTAWAGRLASVFRAVVAFRSEDPGPFVYGLSRQHTPRHGSWYRDAVVLHDALARTGPAGPAKAPPPPAPRPRRSEPVVAVTAEVAAVADQAIPKSWEHWPLVEGRHAVMFGAEHCEPAREAIQAALRLADLTWVDSEKPQHVRALVERIRSRTVDLVLVNKFVSHKVSGKVLKAAKQAGIPAIVVRHGYGVAAIREAIEHARGGAARAA